MKVVAKKYFLNQTAALAPTGVFTSTEGGDYLVNLSVAYATATNTWKRAAISSW